MLVLLLCTHTSVDLCSLAFFAIFPKVVFVVNRAILLFPHPNELVEERVSLHLKFCCNLVVRKLLDGHKYIYEVVQHLVDLEFVFTSKYKVPLIQLDSWDNLISDNP